MQLDNIIYDKDTLATAIAEQWNLESQTFKAMYPSDTATALVNGMAGYGSMLQYMLVSQIANCYTTTAFSDAAIYQLADTLGNTLHGNSPAKVLVNVKRNNLIYKNLIVPAYCQFMLGNRKFFNPSAIIFPPGVTDVTDIDLVQGEIVVVNKYTSGIASEKIYFGSDFKVDNASVEVWVNNELWHVEESFLKYDKNYVLDTSELNTVVLKTTSDGRCYIKFGDGNFANLPAAESSVKIRYILNEGNNGNIEESNVEGTLMTPLSFVDNNQKDVNLNLTITSTVPAYGGFDTQSVTTLAETSPNIFASGHRLVRRSDYKAFLQNNLGYLTAQVWGEYEEAKTQGIDDAIMMNVVYYTGLKSHEFYPYHTIGFVEETDVYQGLIASTRGFYGSYSIRIINTSLNDVSLVYRDDGGKGILFQRFSEEIYDVDDLAATYEDGAVDILEYDAGTIRSSTDHYPITNIVSSNIGSYWQAGISPNLQRPVQILLRFNKDDVLREHGMSIAGFKFMPHASDNFIGEFAVYATISNKDDPQDLDLSNIRNSTSWSKIVDKQSLVKNGGDYTDWVATNSYLLRQQYETATTNRNQYLDQNAYDAGKFYSYVYYVIEIYSTDNSSSTGTLSVEKMKVKYNYDYKKNDNEEYVNEKRYMSSLLDYERNGVIDIIFPENLINSEKYRLWQYVTTIEGVTQQNGYKSGDTLGFIYTNASGDTSIPFKITVQDITNGIFLTEIGNVDTFLTKYAPDTFSNVLASTERIIMKDPASLQRLYSVWAEHSDPASGADNTKYTISSRDFTVINPVANGTLLRLKGIDTVLPITGYAVSYDGSTISEITFANNCSFGEPLEGEYTFVTAYSDETEVATVKLKSTSGKDYIPSSKVGDASNGTLSIKSVANLDVDVSFTGDRISKESVDAIDQVSLNEQNHFTTSVEFRQPEVHQVDISVEVCLNTSASVTNTVIINNVRNAIIKLFDITPNYMGAGLKLSDIYTTIMSVDNVRFCNVIAPTSNVITKPNAFMVLGDLNIKEVAESY
jgi:hypothetical protein